MLQELTGLRGIAGAIATLVTLSIPSSLSLADAGRLVQDLLDDLGTANQLLAALTLVGVSVWVSGAPHWPVWYALLPAIFMLASTGTALVMNFVSFLKAYRVAVGDQPVGNLTNMVIAAVLFLLGLFVVFEAVRVWSKSREGNPRQFVKRTSIRGSQCGLPDTILET